MNTEDLKKALDTYPRPFIQIQGEANFYEGWKLSIQGKTVEDCCFLIDNLIGLLSQTKATFKCGTQKLIDAKHSQQSTKLLTIYIPNNVDPKSFSELVKLNILKYKGAEGVNPPESYTTYSQELGIYYRNDRDTYGEYIPAN